MSNDDTRPVIGFDLYRVAAIKAELDVAEQQDQRRKPGRPRTYTEPRQEVRVALPVALIEQIDRETHNRTAFIEEAVRALLAREGNGGTE